MIKKQIVRYFVRFHKKNAEANEEKEAELSSRHRDRKIKILGKNVVQGKGSGLCKG